AQVVLVSSEPVNGAGELYSINFSYATMDRSWRWRPLPAAVEDPAGRQTASESVDVQTLRLREDMSICLKGHKRTARGLETGYWFQRYLPAVNRLVPEPEDL